MTEAHPISGDFIRSSWRIDGVETFVLEMGSGEPLVFFHGAGTFHGFDWARRLADRFRVIIPFHPNFGESGDAECTSVEDYLMHYEMLFAALELEHFHLMGFSMGGQIAALYAGEHAEEIGRLVLVAPSGLVSPKAKMPDFHAIPPQEMREWFVSDVEFIKPYWPDEPSAQWLSQRERERTAACHLDKGEEALRKHLAEALQEFDKPTLLLWGAKDRLVPVECMEEWQALMPHGETAVIETGAHLLLDESEDACAAAKAFLRR